ncbi:hypothetical protein C7212DRAFT_365374 [Tuber magnatum]|uniref:DNA replication factor Cdt1 C-terminal domain-containing protein n=1 Tax=Tuber magnatum TaxID=42249 RepID=A0A317SMK0_9PEZI|nr:hypothetical protein C7212DRAFT_365374 [Tuber magnatum]
MPPRRKAAAVSQERARTLQSFAGKVSKSVSSTGKAAAVKHGIPSETGVKKVDIKPEKISLKIIQEGDEDVLVPIAIKPELAIVKAEEPVFKVTPTSEPVPVPSPAKKRKRVIDDFFSPPAKKPSTSACTTATRQSPSTPTSSPPLESLPTDLTLLQTLHGSLLTALLLHKAHHNTGTHPASFSAIKLHVERLARRDISLEDLRRIVYISHYGEKVDNGGFKLVDYGAGNICIDLIEKSGARKLASTKLLKEEFGAKLWLYFRRHGGDSNTQLITPPSSFTEDDKGEEKEGAGKKISAHEPTVPLAEIAAHPQAATIQSVLRGKNQAILKELRKPSSVPSPKSAAAGQRIPEVEPILRSLAGRGINMTMKSVVEGIKESTRNPISMEDAEKVVRVMAEREGGKGWVRVVEVGKVTGVVFTKRGTTGFE